MERKYNLDCLRSLCMFYVLLVHIVGHSGFLELIKDSRDLTFYIVNYIACCARVSVLVFVIITGYFGVTLKIRKVLKLEYKLLFYGFFTFLISILINKNINLNLLDILKTILPFSYTSWWFMSHYIVLLLFSPFINILIENLNRKQHFILIFICIFLFNIISSFSLAPIDTTNGYGFNNFILLYLIGRYLRIYSPHKNKNKTRYLIGYIILSLCILMSYIIYGNYKFGTHNSVLVLCSSINLFCFFDNISIKSNYFSKISPYVLAVYLITDSFYLREIINSQIFNPCNYADSLIVILYIIIYSVILFIVCIIIDSFVEKYFSKVFDNITNFVIKKFKFLEIMDKI